VIALRAAVEAFLAADPEAWSGLPSPVTLADLAGLVPFDGTDRRRGDAGDPAGHRDWIAAETRVYSGGLRLWLDADHREVVALEGIHPLDPAGEFRAAPDLGAPDATFAAVLGPLWLPDAELVYAARGLAMRRNPTNGLLLGLVGFAPTDVRDYRTRLRPVPEPTRPLAIGRLR
jgi:hypothetical protein